MLSLQTHFSRRHFLKSSGLAAASLAVPRRIVAGQEVSTPGLVEKARNGAASAQIAVEKLRGNVSVLSGGGGNIAVLSGHDGKVLVDAGFAGARPKISEALAGISSDPIMHLINTHWHFDHTDGNEWIQKSGATILAHENTRKHLSTTTRVAGWDFTFPPAPEGAIPTKVFESNTVLELNGATVALNGYPPAHTDGDISVHFAEEDILHVADTFWNGYYPFIDYSTGGSIEGMIRATESNLATVTSKTIIIPGHGPVADKAQLTAYRDLLVTVRDKVAALKTRGQSLDEVLASRPTANYDAQWGGGFMSPRMFTGLVYLGV